MSIATQNLSFNTLFPSLDAISANLQALRRLTHLSIQLGKDADRQTTWERLNELAQHCFDTTTQMQPSQTQTYASLKEKYGDQLTAVYFNRKQDSFSRDEIAGITSCILQDLQSVLYPPIQASRLGKNGPTLLVNYPLVASPGNISFHAYVIKWSDLIELVSNRIYSEFLSTLPLDREVTVPQTIGIDFERDTAIFPAGMTARIDPSLALATHLNRIAGFVNRSPKSSKKVLLSEKVVGQNIADFVSSEEYTDARKASFFFKIGYIAMLDVMMGYFERFVACDPDQDEILAMNRELPANLGNAMIIRSDAQRQDSPITLAPIDNGISPIFCISDKGQLEWSNQSRRDKYNETLKKLVSSPEGYMVIVNNIIYSLKIYAEVIKKRDQTKFETFFADLENDAICKENLIRGLEQMHRDLLQFIIPFWNSDRSVAIKNYIQQYCSGLLPPLNERLQILEQFSHYRR